MPHVNAHHKRVSLAGKDLDLIHVQWLNVGSFYLDYSQCVVVDGELPVWSAGNGNKAEAVPTAEVINSHNCRQGLQAHLFPCWTLTTESGVAGPPAQRPAPLMSVLLKAGGPVGASLAR
jgi:hypothetical protein